MIRITGMSSVIMASLLISSGISNFFDFNNARGEILEVQTLPELLPGGHNEIFEIKVRNLGNDSSFLILVHRDFQLIAAHTFKLNASSNKSISLSTSHPPFIGEFNYTCTLYSGSLGGNNVLLDSVSQKKRVYSQKELSDEDQDGLKYFEEKEMGTDPELADTDRDTIPDNIDPEPTNFTSVQDKN